MPAAVPCTVMVSSPAQPYTRRQLASLPGVTRGDRLSAIPGVVPAIGHLPRGCAFAPRCGDRFEPCDLEPPPDTDVNEDHSVRCYLYGTPVPSTARNKP